MDRVVSPPWIAIFSGIVSWQRLTRHPFLHGSFFPISIHSPIAETDSKYTYIFHILLIFFIKLYHIPLLYTSHPPIDYHFHQNINYITWCKSLTVFMCTWHPHQSNIGSKSKAIYKNLWTPSSLHLITYHMLQNHDKPMQIKITMVSHIHDYGLNIRLIIYT